MIISDERRKMMMMTRSKDEKGFAVKGIAAGDDIKKSKSSKAAASSRSTSSGKWLSAFRNPRIVCVSRAFGGKDRHSKVCTVRGLRDRRIRLSVPTAIQLYDLQDRLGLSQPSKVIDWLLDATKHDIDKLPPLPMFPASHLNQQSSSLPSYVHDHLNASQASFSPFFATNTAYFKDGEASSNAVGSKLKGVLERESMDIGKAKWMSSYDHQQENNQAAAVGKVQVSANNFLHIYNYNNNLKHHLEPCSLSLSQFGFPSQPQTEGPNSSHLPLSSYSGSQLFLSQPAVATPSIFPPYFSSPADNNILQFFSPNAHNVMPNPLLSSSLSTTTTTSKLLPHHSHYHGMESNKGPAR